MRKGYIVLAQAFEYNDEYFSSLDNAYQTVSIAYATRERAEKEAKKVNVEHAYQVAGDLRDWTYGERAGEMFRHEPEEDVMELARKVFDDPPKDFEDALDKFDNLDELPLDQVDLEWLVDKFSAFRIAYVGELEIEEEVIG